MPRTLCCQAEDRRSVSVIEGGDVRRTLLTCSACGSFAGVFDQCTKQGMAKAKKRADAAFREAMANPDHPMHKPENRQPAYKEEEEDAPR